MKNKLQQKICAMFQRTIQFSQHIFSKETYEVVKSIETTIISHEQICLDNFKKIFNE